MSAMTMTRATGFSEYVAARWPALIRTAYLLTGHPQTAEDLLQSTLVKAYVQWEKITRAEYPDAYVKRMLLNELLSGRRREIRRERIAPVTHEPPPAAGDTDPAERLDLWRRLQSLPPRQRAVIVLRYYEDLTEAEIATVLRIAPGTVKSQASAALRALRSGFITEEEVS